MNFKRRRHRWALYRSRWMPRGVGIPHGYSAQVYVGSITADAESIPDSLKDQLTESELLNVERRVCAPARAVRLAREAEASRLAEDPGWRLIKATELVSEAAELSLTKHVHMSRVEAVQRSLAGVHVHEADGVRHSLARPDVMRVALAAIVSAAKAVREGALGSAPSTGARNTRTYALWAHIVEAVEGSSDNSLLAALQARGFVKRKRR